MNITENFIKLGCKGRPGTKRSKTTKIAWHYVGNAGSSASGNRNYFENSGASASSHYIVGLDGEILYIVPEHEVAYTTNNANAYSLGVETCHPTNDGHYNQKTYNSMVELGAMLCKKYGLDPINDMIRHYDVTKKVCPRWFVDNPNEWTKFKQDVKNKMGGSTSTTPSNSENKYSNGDYDCNFKVTADELNVRASRPSNGKLGNEIGKLKHGDIFKGGYCLNNWMGLVLNGKQGFVNAKYIEKVKETSSKPNTPSTSKPWENGTYKVRARVTTNLNCRKGRPGQSKYSQIIKTIPKGTIIEIDYCLNGWFSTYYFGQVGFVSGDYIELI